MIRLARLADIEAIRAMERSANALFRDIQMDDVATLEPTSVEELQSLIAIGQVWVWVDEADEPFASVLVTVEGRDAHVEQITVHPSHERQGYGRRLLDHVIVWAAERDLTGVTLTTFTQVPWNGPYYARLGFVVLPDSALSEDQRARMAQNATGVLGQWPRVTMRRAVKGP